MMARALSADDASRPPGSPWSSRCRRATAWDRPKDGCASPRAAATRHGPDLDQRVALHHVIALVEVDRGIAVRRRQDDLLAMAWRRFPFGRDHREMLVAHEARGRPFDR